MRPYTQVDKASGMLAISLCLWKALSHSCSVCLQPSTKKSDELKIVETLSLKLPIKSSKV